MTTACTPRVRWAEREAVQQYEHEQEVTERELRLEETELDSLANPDRPRVLHPAGWPEKITVRIASYTIPVAITVETGPGPDESTTTGWTVTTDDPEVAMAGAEVALAALGYTLDRFRLYQDMSLTVGHFYRKEGPYA